MSGSFFERSRERRHRWRLILAAGVLVVLFVLLAFLVRGCSTSNGSGDRASNAASPSGQKPAPPDANAKKITSKEDTTPYKAIAPPAGATSAITTGTGGGTAGGTTMGIPTGSMLVAGASDTTNGPLRHNRMVTFYGTPLSPQMGVLGQYSMKEMVSRLKQQAAAYSAADPSHPAIPTIELIASVAQRTPGPNGQYILQTPRNVIERYAKLAKDNGCLLLLDVQLGTASVDQEVKLLTPFLKRPYVHLAIDTEYSVGPGQVPGVNLGHVDASEIMAASRTLTRLVEQEKLPAKVLVIHQFAEGIVTNKDQLHPTPHVEMVLNADGFGSPANKISKYNQLVRNEAPQYGGFKLFYTQDVPLIQPDTVLNFQPAPAVVNYQ